jgi:hypothetical protein
MSKRSFLSVLDEIATTVVKIAEDASAVIPILQPLQLLLPKPAQTAFQQISAAIPPDKLQAIINLSQQGEAFMAAMSGKTEGNGLSIATGLAPAISATFQDLEVLGGKKISGVIKDPAEFNAAMQDMAKAVGRALNACGK